MNNNLSPFDKDNRMPACIVTLDLGNNYLKVWAFMDYGNKVDTECFIIPHAYVELNDAGWAEAERSTKLSRKRQQQTHTFRLVTDNIDKPVTIGRGVLTNPRNRPLLGSNKYVEGGIDALLVAALCELFPKEKYPKGHDNIILSYGFPSTEWQQTPHIDNLLKGKHRFIDPDGSKRSFYVRAISSFDEVVGGLIYAVSNNTRDPKSGQFKERTFEVGDKIVVIDAGGKLGSIGWATIGEHGFPEVDYERGFTSIDGGAITVRQDLRESLKVKHPDLLKGMREIDMTDDWLDQIIATEKMILSGDKDHPIDVSDAVADSLHYLKLIKDPYRNEFANGRQADHVLLTGGTVKPLYNKILPILEHQSAITSAALDEIIVANVRGGGIILMDKLIADDVVPKAFRKAVRTI